MKNSVKKLIEDLIIRAACHLVEAIIVYIISKLLTTEKRRIIARVLIKDIKDKVLDLIDEVEKREKEEEQQNKEA